MVTISIRAAYEDIIRAHTKGQHVMILGSLPGGKSKLLISLINDPQIRLDSIVDLSNFSTRSEEGLEVNYSHLTEALLKREAWILEGQYPEDQAFFNCTVGCRLGKQINVFVITGDGTLVQMIVRSRILKASLGYSRNDIRRLATAGNLIISDNRAIAKVYPPKPLSRVLANLLIEMRFISIRLLISLLRPELDTLEGKIEMTELSFQRWISHKGDVTLHKRKLNALLEMEYKPLYDWFVAHHNAPLLFKDIAVVNFNHVLDILNNEGLWVEGGINDWDERKWDGLPWAEFPSHSL
jgi:hypothetical protein